MNERTIKRPTGPAVIFLLTAMGFIFTIFSHSVLTQLLEQLDELQPMAIFRFVLWGVTNLFMSIILFSKKYDNWLIIGSGILLIPSIFTLFLNISPYLISEIIFYLILIVFTYVMVKMPETPIREKVVKFRFIIPLFQFILILISTIQSIRGVYENYMETNGAYTTGSISIAMVLLPSILSSISGFLPVLCYVWLANWLANPYEKQ